MVRNYWFEIGFVVFLAVFLIIFAVFLRKRMKKRFEKYFMAKKIAKKRKTNPCYKCPSHRKYVCDGCFRKLRREYEAERGENDG